MTKYTYDSNGTTRGTVIGTDTSGLLKSALVQVYADHNATNNALPEPTIDLLDELSPKFIYDHISKYVVGQDEAVKAVATAAALHRARCNYARANNGKILKKSNLLLMGPSGCGKTYILNQLESLGFDVLKITSTSFSREGFKGNNLSDYLSTLKTKVYKRLSAKTSSATGLKSKTKQFLSEAIVFIDEVDKLCFSSRTTTSEDHNRELQNTLLTFVEGSPVSVHGGTIDTSGMLFVFGGSFQFIRDQRKAKKKPIGFNRVDEEEELETLHNEIRAAGIITELAGRISQVVELNELLVDDLVNILKKSKGSVSKEFNELMKWKGVNVRIKDKQLKKIAEAAIKNGTGARGLQTELDHVVRDALFNADNWEGGDEGSKELEK